ncbi:MAG: hypothetical protein ACP5UM_09390 [Anaerolineae bacterium]
MASGRWRVWWFLAWLCLYLATASGRIHHGDDETRFQMVQSLVEQGTLRIGHRVVEMPAMPLPGLLPQHGYTFETTMPVASPRDGALYSKYSPGQSFLILPLYLLGRSVALAAWPAARADLTRLTVAFWNPLWGAAAVALLSAFLVRLGYRRGTALMAGAAYGLASMGWTYTKTFFSEPAVGVCLLLSVWALWEARTGGRVAWAWAAGAASGLALLLRHTTAVLHLPWLTAYLLWPRPGSEGRSWLARALPAWALPVALGGGLHLAYNLYCWTPEHFLGYPEARWDVPFLLGLWGQAFSPGKGVFLYTPWLVAAVMGLALAWRKHRGLVALAATLWAAYLAFHASYAYWTGGWNWGPRFLLPLLPLSTLGLAHLWEEDRVRGARGVILALLLLGVGVQVPAVLVDHSRYLVHLAETAGPRWYDRSLYEPDLSPLAHQWRMVGEVAALWRDPTARDAVRSLVAEHFGRLQALAGDLEAAGAEALWLAEFVRLNVPDFWWVHLGLLGAPTWCVWGIPLALLAGAVVSLSFCLRSVHGEGVGSRG